MYIDKQAWAKSVDPDQMLQNAASDMGLHYLLLIQQFLYKSIIGKIDFRISKVFCWLIFEFHKVLSC